MLSDIQKEIQGMESSDSSLVNSFISVTQSTNNTNVDDLTLFGMISPSTSNAESIDSELAGELERRIEDVVRESSESPCIENSEIDDTKCEKQSLNENLITEVACTKQTAWKQPQGLPVVTNPPPASGGSGAGNSPVGTSGKGGGKSPRNPLPKKVPRKVPGGKS